MSELNLILIGPPGAGKGTQAERLQADFDLPYLATGDMMRAAKKEDSDLGREVKGHVESGDLVPDEIVCRVLMARLDDEGDDGFILDGFPRNPAQADVLEGGLAQRGRSLTAALVIEVQDDVIVERLAGRRVCAKGHPYHVEFNKPKHPGVCDIDGTRLIQRDDDKPETIRHRLAVYHDQTEPLVERYDQQGILRRFDGTRSPDEVHGHIRATLATIRLEEGI